MTDQSTTGDEGSTDSTTYGDDADASLPSLTNDSAAPTDVLTEAGVAVSPVDAGEPVDGCTCAFFGQQFGTSACGPLDCNSATNCGACPDGSLCIGVYENAGGYCCRPDHCIKSSAGDCYYWDHNCTSWPIACASCCAGGIYLDGGGPCP